MHLIDNQFPQPIYEAMMAEVDKLLDILEGGFGVWNIEWAYSGRSNLFI